jgi:glycosyltransferase involved in cell wall biosynthesis
MASSNTEIDIIQFSIIIPTYNSTPTLTRCLDSIINQKNKNFEVWFIDGVSTDGTLDIIKKYQSVYPYINYISESDKGIYDAMNKGIALARGEYLYFLGSDDTLYNENIFAVVSTEIKKSQAKILYGNVLMIGNNESGKYTELLHAGKFDLKRLFSHNICHQSIFYHHSVFKESGNFNTKYAIYADYDLNLRCIANYEFLYLDKIIANFNLGGASTQITDQEFEKDKDANIIKYFLNKLHTKPFVDLRLFVQRAAFSKKVKVSFLIRLYCLLVYAKLKTQSLIK